MIGVLTPMNTIVSTIDTELNMHEVPTSYTISDGPVVVMHLLIRLPQNVGIDRTENKTTSCSSLLRLSSWWLLLLYEAFRVQHWGHSIDHPVVTNDVLP